MFTSWYFSIVFHFMTNFLKKPGRTSQWDKAISHKLLIFFLKTQKKLSRSVTRARKLTPQFIELCNNFTTTRIRKRTNNNNKAVRVKNLRNFVSSSQPIRKNTLDSERRSIEYCARNSVQRNLISLRRWNTESQYRHLNSKKSLFVWALGGFFLSLSMRKY